MASDRRILVTGGTGFIGGRFAEVIHLTGFGRVRVGVRRWAGAARAARFPVEIVLCDVLDRRQLAEAMAGVSAVIHCAVGDDEVVVTGTRNVLDAAARAGVERVVYMSTAEVYGRPSGTIDETCPFARGVSSYGDVKILAEEACWDAYARGLPVTMFRPSIVYGPWSTSWTAALAERIASGRWARYERFGEGICNLVYVDDLVAAALSSIDRPVAGQAFNIGGRELLTWNDYFDRLNAAMGLPPLQVAAATNARVRSVAHGAGRVVARFGKAHAGRLLSSLQSRGGVAAKALKSVKQWLRTTPSSGELDGLYNRKAVYVWSKAEQLLGYQPQFDLDTGLALSVEWLRYAGIVNGASGAEHAAAPARGDTAIPHQTDRQAINVGAS
jgi:nucleoside-diphosphate-sugar epimerase